MLKVFPLFFQGVVKVGTDPVVCFIGVANAEVEFYRELPMFKLATLNQEIKLP